MLRARAVKTEVGQRYTATNVRARTPPALRTHKYRTQRRAFRDVQPIHRRGRLVATLQKTERLQGFLDHANVQNVPGAFVQEGRRATAFRWRVLACFSQFFQTLLRLLVAVVVEDNVNADAQADRC